MTTPEPPDWTCPLRSMILQQSPSWAWPDLRQPRPVRAPVPPPRDEVPDPPRLLWSIKDAAKRLSVSERTLGGIARSGALPSVKLGNRRMVAEVDLREYVERLRDAGGD